MEKNEYDLLPVADEVLRRVPGLEAVHGGTMGRPDIVLRFGDRTLFVDVKARQAVNTATAHQIIRDWQPRVGRQLLVVARDMTAEARRLLADNGIGAIDAAGRAHLEYPGLLVHLDAQRHVPHAAQHLQKLAPVQRLRGRAGAVVHVLLREPDRPWHGTELAHRAGVSVPVAHRVLARLGEEGLVRVEGAGPQRVRYVTDRAGLLDLWAEEHRPRAKATRAHVLARTPDEAERTVADAMDELGLRYALTGPAAARHVAPFTTAIAVTDLWVTADVQLEPALAQLGIDVVDRGHNVVFRQELGDPAIEHRAKRDRLWLVDPLQLYLDLRADPKRGREQALHLREEVIGF